MTLSPAKYLALFLSVTGALLLAVAVLNYVADPCGIYHYGKRWDWIHSRPNVLDLCFVFKAKAVENAQADTLFLGSSRTAEGLDPHNPAVPGPAFNLGLPGSSMYEQWRYFQHACAAHMPTTLVLGVDMNQFPARRNSNALFSEDRLLVRPDGTPTPFLLRTFADFAPTLLSLSTAELSLQTLRAQRTSHLAFEAGFESDAPKVAEHLDMAASVRAANIKWLADSATVQFRTPDGHMPQFDAFDQLLDFCADHHIHLIMYLQPVHAAALDAYTHEWDLYCDWLKTVVAHVDAKPNLHVEFWDFTGYNSMNTEPFPGPTDKYSHMHYYWEGSHYRKIVGDAVLERVFTGQGPTGFGCKINGANIGQDLQRVASEKMAWHSHHEAVPISIDNAQAQSTP